MESPEASADLPSPGRRTFIAHSVKSAAALAILSLKPPFATAGIAGHAPAAGIAGHAPAAGIAGQSSAATRSSAESYTVQGIIDTILKDGALTPFPGTVDTIKIGKPEQVVTGIITTMFPTINVIKAAISRNANFIIAHEPSFYNHRDDTNWVKDNSVLAQKTKLLSENNMAIWRFHDYCHALKPDAIAYGFVRKAGWLSYFKPGQFVLTIPPMTFRELIQHLMSTLGITHLRVIGDAQQQCQRIAFLPGAAGGQTQVSFIEKEKPDVLIVGESSEWETPEYIRDEQSFGGKTALIILGHCVSEEPGMEWVAEWLTPKFPGIVVSHVPSGDPFTWVSSL
jgi:putative NIF3 family GTP cyclohydrolase 1 type 2